MDWVKARLSDPEVLVRLNGFFLSYFGWMFFGVLYSFLGRWSVDLTPYFLRLPLTSRHFVVGLIDFTRSIPPLYVLFNGVYYIGFTGSIAFMVLYLLIYLRDFETSDRLLASYILSYLFAGMAYVVFHIYAPHVVYHLPGYTSGNTLLTRQEFVLPSLHNTIITVNILLLWKYRDRMGARVLIFLNGLIPFATFFLGHHWVYDIFTGFLLGIFACRLSKGIAMGIPRKLYNWELSSLRKITVVNFVLVLIILLVALNPNRIVEIINGIVENP